jgi:hypothetical protein
LVVVQESIDHGVLECCYKVAGFATITPVLHYSSTPKLQCSEINLKSQFHGGLVFFLFIESVFKNYGLNIKYRSRIKKFKSFCKIIIDN